MMYCKSTPSHQKTLKNYEAYICSRKQLQYFEHNNDENGNATSEIIFFVEFHAEMTVFHAYTLYKRNIVEIRTYCITWKSF